MSPKTRASPSLLRTTPPPVCSAPGEDIEASARGNGHSVLVLGRYNTSKDALPSKLPWEEFSTIHRAKGREADYVVVLDLKDGRWGFPSRIEDNFAA